MAKHDVPGVGEYGGPAGGWGALQAVAKALRGQMTAQRTTIMLQVNQPEGFDCPGCAWPDPREGSSFEFCENGAKAVSWEATNKRVTPEFFAQHTVSELWGWEDFALEWEGRLTHPMVYDAATDRYVPIAWDDAFARIGTILRNLPDPDMAEFYASGRASNEAAFLYQLPTAPTTSPTARTCATRRPASGCRNRSAWARGPYRWRISTIATRSSRSATTRARTTRACWRRCARHGCATSPSSCSTR